MAECRNDPMAGWADVTVGSVWHLPRGVPPWDGDARAKLYEAVEYGREAWGPCALDAIKAWEDGQVVTDYWYSEGYLWVWTEG